MELLEIVEKLREAFPGEILEWIEHRGQMGVIVRRDRILEMCRFLHDDSEIQMNHLMDLCGVDYGDRKDVRFEVVYNLYSIPLRHMIRLRAQVPEDDCRIDSVTSLWTGADWHERETYDLMGIVFEGHPDLRRVLLPETWEGHPLRKDYPVQGPEKEWSGYEEVKAVARRLKKYDFYGAAEWTDEEESRARAGEAGYVKE